MPFTMKIQPINSDAEVMLDQAKPVVKSRLKRLFERQFPSVRRTLPAEKLTVIGAKDNDQDPAAADLELSSVVLDKMVQSFIEESGERPPARSCRRSSCFQGNCSDSSDDEDLDFYSASDIKFLLLCTSVTERNLAADASAIVERFKNAKGKEESRRILAAELRSLGYDAAICKSRWEKTPSYPSGEHEYVDVIVDGDRLLIEVDIRSEFEIARSTMSYSVLIQSLPVIFVGTADRVAEIVTVVSEGAKRSLRKKGLHLPPWRKREYMSAKWLAPYSRGTRDVIAVSVDDGKDEKMAAAVGVTWKPPPVLPKVRRNGANVVTGLSLVLHGKA